MRELNKPNLAVKHIESCAECPLGMVFGVHDGFATDELTCYKDQGQPPACPINAVTEKADLRPRNRGLVIAGILEVIIDALPPGSEVKTEKFAAVVRLVLEQYARDAAVGMVRKALNKSFVPIEKVLPLGSRKAARWETRPRDATIISTSLKNWHGEQACDGMDVNNFYNDGDMELSDVRKVCAGCQIAHECLAEALSIGDRFGIFGGLKEKERERLKPLLAAEGIKSEQLTGISVYVKGFSVECSIKYKVGENEITKKFILSKKGSSLVR